MRFKNWFSNLFYRRRLKRGTLITFRKITFEKRASLEKLIERLPPGHPVSEDLKELLAENFKRS